MFWMFRESVSTAMVPNLFDLSAPCQEFMQLVAPCQKRYIACGTLEKLNQFDESFVPPKIYFYSLILKENHEGLEFRHSHFARAQ